MSLSLSKMHDSLVDSLPSVVAVIPHGGANGAPPDHRVIPHPAISASLLERFGTYAGMRLFWPNRHVALPLRDFVAAVSLRVCALAAGHLASRQDMLPWARVARLVAERLNGAEESAPDVPPAPSSLIGLRRRLVTSLPVTDPIMRAVEQRRPFILVGDRHLLHLRSGWAFGRTARVNDVVEAVELSEPWYHPILRAVEGELPTADDLDQHAIDRALVTSLIAGDTIRGRDRYEGFTLSAPSPKRIRIAYEAGAAFFQETTPGQVVLWPPLTVFVEGADDEIFRAPLNLSVSVLPSPCPRLPSAFQRMRGLLSGFAGDPSNVAAHAFVSERMTICLGPTGARYRQMGRYQSIVDVILEAHLRAAARVLRYGWRASNTAQNYHHDYRGHPLQPGLHPISLSAAQSWASKHPEMELVRWDR